ncbi:MAG: dTDP-4-dehydrorhamnose 3,5-epimerase family protein [Chloroflexota bacterium]
MRYLEVVELNLRPDERGFFCELYRVDWSTLFPEPVVQVNLCLSYPGIVRAWHRHARGQVDYFIVVQGSLRICAFDASTGEMEEVVASDRKPEVVRVPGNQYHGTMAVGCSPPLMVYGTTKLYDYDNPDEERLPWNDVSIVPKTVNGRSDDPRVGHCWDWLRPVHK